MNNKFKFNIETVNNISNIYSNNNLAQTISFIDNILSTSYHNSDSNSLNLPHNLVPSYLPNILRSYNATQSLSPLYLNHISENALSTFSALPQARFTNSIDSKFEYNINFPSNFVNINSNLMQTTTQDFSLNEGTQSLLNNALKFSLPYENAKLFIDKSINLDDTIKNISIFSNTDSAITTLLDTKPLADNVLLHNMSDIFNPISTMDVDLATKLSSTMSPYKTSAFLIDSNILGTDSLLLNNFISNSMDYISNLNFIDSALDTPILSLSSSGFEIINGSNEDSILLEDIQLADDIIGLESIEKKDLNDFYRFIKKYPMLALADTNGIGNKILNIIKEDFNKNLITEKAPYLFKAREYTDTEKDMTFCEEDLYLAPYGKPGRGRFNSPDLNHLYLSLNLTTTLLELDIKQEQKYSILVCSPKHSIKLFDLTKGNYTLQEFCLKKNISSNKTEYLFPNFISNCCRLAGYDGIKYRSVKNKSCLNYVLFDYSSSNFVTINISDYTIKEVINEDTAIMFDDNNTEILLNTIESTYLS